MSTNINNKQIAAARMLAQGKRAKTVAAELGVSPETISRWRREHAFIAMQNELHGEAHDDARDRLRAVVNDAVDVLQNLLHDESTPPKVKLETSMAVLRIVGITEDSKRAVGPCDAKTVKDHESWKQMAHEKLLCGEG
jgi:hypothetical protein